SVSGMSSRLAISPRVWPCDHSSTIKIRPNESHLAYTIMRATVQIIVKHCFTGPYLPPQPRKQPNVSLAVCQSDHVKVHPQRYIEPRITTCPLVYTAVAQIVAKLPR